MRVFSFYVDGATPAWVEIEYHSRFQIPGFQILGLPGPEIQEARERIVAAFQNSELEFPKRKVIVNLTPSSLRKRGTGHDLGMAIKIISEISDRKFPESALAWGELGLDGTVKAVGKIAHLIELLIHAKNTSHPSRIYLSIEDAERYLSLIQWRENQQLENPKQIEVYGIAHLKDFETLKPLTMMEIPLPHTSGREFSEATLLPLLPEQERIIQIAILGRHHTLLMGPKGVGKSAALDWFKALIPDSEGAETWDRILKQESRNEIFEWGAPIRQVGSDVKPAHLLGSWAERGYQAGELAMAHGGILFADEFMEWARDSKECLREPLQCKRVRITRTRGTLESACDLQLIATGNLCPCGGLPKIFRNGKALKGPSCRCSEYQVKEYLSKLSGPIADRLDLVILMTAQTSLDEYRNNNVSDLRMKIKNARDFSIEHFGNLPSRLDPKWLEEHLPDEAKIRELLSTLPSLRSRHKVLRVARSIQALENAAKLNAAHVFEAKNYRLFDQLKTPAMVGGGIYRSATTSGLT